MPDFSSFSDLFRVARDEVLARNSRLSREAVEREGMDANVLTAAACAMGDEVVGQLNDLASALFLDSATDIDLDRLVFDRYGLIRKPAAASVGSVQFTTTVASPTTFAIPTGTILQTSAGVQYITTESVLFVLGSSGPVTAAVRSALAGLGQNAKAGTITGVVSSIPGAAADLKVSNTFATAGGDDAESDPALRDRARRFFVTARRGTNAAIEEAALGVPGVRSATVFEVLDALGRPARLAQLVVTDAFTEQFVNFETIPARYEVQSQVLASQVSAALADVRPAGTYVQVTVANVVLQTVQLALAFLAGASVNDAALQARAAIVNLTNSLAPGDPLRIVDMLAALQLVPGLRFTGNEIVSPAGDVIAMPLQVIRSTLGLVSALSAQTDQPVITGSNPDAFILAGG